MYLLGHCREGYEEIAASELKQSSLRGSVGKLQKFPGLFAFAWTGNATQLADFSCEDLVFTRELILAFELVDGLPEKDRVGPLMDALAQGVSKIGLERLYKDVYIEHPDSDSLKTLSRFCTSFERPFGNGLKRTEFRKVFTRADVPRIHVVFLSFEKAFVGISFSRMADQWPMGIPRLKFPAGAPSRSCLKLEEAFLRFLTKAERAELLQAGATAVDLGAAPGGWTFQLVKSDVFVTAVDRGSLTPELTSNDLVRHRTDDAFKYAPESQVDWLVCDVVENPYRISDLVGEWARRRWFRQAVVNLKLPVGDKWECVYECLNRIKEKTRHADGKARVLGKHLYHDRDEVTIFIQLLEKRS